MEFNAFILKSAVCVYEGEREGESWRDVWND